MSEMKIVELTRTCIACPSQWDAKLDDGRPVYIRFRWNWCSVRVGEIDGDKWSAVRGEEVLGFEWGEHPLCGDMSNEQLIEELIARGWEVKVDKIEDPYEGEYDE